MKVSPSNVLGLICCGRRPDDRHINSQHRSIEEDSLQ